MNKKLKQYNVFLYLLNLIRVKIMLQMLNVLLLKFIYWVDYKKSKEGLSVFFMKCV